MNLRFAGCSENGGLYFGKAAVNRQNALLHVRFAKSRDAQFAMDEADAGDAGLQARQHVLEKHGFHLARRSGQERDHAALVIQQPNYFGQLEDVDALTDWAHAHSALVIAVVNPTSLAVLKAPAQWGTRGADIVVGDGNGVVVVPSSLYPRT